MRCGSLIVALILAVFPVLAQASPKAGETVAFLGITYLDTSAEGDIYGTPPEELARMDLVRNYVAEWFEEEGMVLMDLSPISEDLDRVVNPAKCYGCDVRMGQKLGSDYILVGEVQKVSNLILSMNLVLKDTETGNMVRGQSVDIRSNTDDSWLRGMRYILKNNIFREER